MFPRDKERNERTLALQERFPTGTKILVEVEVLDVGVSDPWPTDFIVCRSSRSDLIVFPKDVRVRDANENASPRKDLVPTKVKKDSRTLTTGDKFFLSDQMSGSPMTYCSVLPHDDKRFVSVFEDTARALIGLHAEVWVIENKCPICGGQESFEAELATPHQTANGEFLRADVLCPLCVPESID